MSRIGKLPIEIPKGVEVKLQNDEVTVKGPKGTLMRKMMHGIKVELKDDQAIVTNVSTDQKNRAFHGLCRTLVYNMVQGVTKGFEKKLILNGVGYRGAKQGKKLVLSLGFSHPVEIDPPAGVDLNIKGTEVVVSGIDKELVGQIAANIRATRPVEPYKGKGIKYDYEVVRRKAGKAAKTAAGAA